MKQKQALSTLSLAGALALLIALAVVVSPVDARPPGDDYSLQKLPCEAYTYSSCPDECVAQCVPSFCVELPGGGAICTADCEGPGSCRTRGAS